MNIDHIKVIAVIGAGTMGHGIAQVAAQSGYKVLLVDVEQSIVEKGLEKIKKSIEKLVEKGKIKNEDINNIILRIEGCTNIEEAGKADFVIEAIVENKDIKRDIFSILDRVCKDRVIFASNTSYLSITEMASYTNRPDRFIGMHWFNPPQLMKLIEIARGANTSDETVEVVRSLAKRMGKTPFVCKDSPGFVVNRILQPWYNEGMRMVDEGVASIEDIDKAIKIGGKFRMGPLELRDFVGLDMALKGTKAIYEQLRSNKFKPPRCLVELVKAGRYGRKTGKGFYDYTKGDKK
jgi:3-hydroxybutyryl-CoA dehydrogenase